MRGMLSEVQVCPAMRRRARFKVRSESSPDVEYEVEVSVIVGQVTCTCPGFRFRGTCHHTALQEDKCGWVEGGPGAERQTAEQHAGAICPRCGHATILVAGSTEAQDDSEGALRARGIRVPPPPK